MFSIWGISYSQLRRLCWLIASSIFLVTPSCAVSGVDISDPTAFFTNFSSRLLQTELNLDLARIQVWPTNQYTPAVHRLLQVTANIYDATTNRAATDFPFLPSVFRPLFRQDAGGVFIAGYREVTDANIASATTAPAMVDVADDTARALIPLWGTPFDPNDQNEPMVYGIPLVIGAKKGFPNFNKFALQNVVTVARKLTFHRNPQQPVDRTNQMYIVGISNIFGVQAWNSYSNTFPRDLEIVVAGRNLTPAP